MFHDKFFGGHKRAGFYRQKNPDPEALRQMAFMRLVIVNVAQVYHIPPAMIVHGRRGRQKISTARQIAGYLCHIGFGITLTRIGLAFNRDRSSISHSCKRIEEMRDDAHFDRSLQCLENSLAVLANTLVAGEH
jgi:chromosomal replication initiation ATPase DnaA